MISISENNLAIIEHCSTINPAHYNFNKALEEAIEFQEVIVKLQTKSVKNTKRPDEFSALTEYGDLIYRGLIALKTIFPNVTTEEIMNDVSTHINKKISRLGVLQGEGKYKGGL